MGWILHFGSTTLVYPLTAKKSLTDAGTAFTSVLIQHRSLTL
ncbi:hypothetical protein FDUTEX481_05974 [Tolypothrix sp. PCC 7601]|nr:hypothetical protein FDUTEX481_05974 [Tolypothrix sp. PCC 7601]